MRLGQDVLAHLNLALAEEWVLANGIGGSASGTAAGARTRRAHAHLVAVSDDGRPLTLVLGLDERLSLDGSVHELTTHLRAGGAARPAGHRLLDGFALDPWPIWRFRAGAARLEKSLALVHGHSAVLVTYRNAGAVPFRIAVSPLLVARDPTEAQSRTLNPAGAVKGMPGKVRFELFEDAPALTVWHDGAFLPVRAWQRELCHPAEGRGDCEEAFVPGCFEASLAPGDALHWVAATEDDLFRTLAKEDRLGETPPRRLAECAAAIEDDERQRIARWRAAARWGAASTAREAHAAHGADPPGTNGAEASPEPPVPGGVEGWIDGLAERLRQSLVVRERRVVLLRALPHGGERTSDSLRAVPGLLALRAFDVVREMLRGCIEYLSDGWAPGTFDAAGRPIYDDPAATLWLAVACERYARRSGDLELVRDPMYPALEEAMRCYRSGSHAVRLGDDGLLAVGEGDAEECPTELNALWNRASLAMAQLARAIGRKENGAFYLAWAHEHQARWLERLWDDAQGCLHRAWSTSAGARRGLGPEQALAVTPEPALLPRDLALRLVERIERELWTGTGLRASAGATAGTEWIGAFLTAWVRVHKRSPESIASAQAMLARALEALDRDARRDPGALTTLGAAELLRFGIEELHAASIAEPLAAG